MIDLQERVKSRMAEGPVAVAASCRDWSNGECLEGTEDDDWIRGARVRLLAAHGTIDKQRSDLDKLTQLLRYAVDVIDHEVKPPTACGACGTPNAQCDGDCVEASRFCTYLRQMRAAVKDAAR